MYCRYVPFLDQCSKSNRVPPFLKNVSGKNYCIEVNDKCITLKEHKKIQEKAKQKKIEEETKKFKAEKEKLETQRKKLEKEETQRKKDAEDKAKKIKMEKEKLQKELIEKLKPKKLTETSRINKNIISEDYNYPIKASEDYFDSQISTHIKKIIKTGKFNECNIPKIAEATDITNIKINKISMNKSEEEGNENPNVIIDIDAKYKNRKLGLIGKTSFKFEKSPLVTEAKIYAYVDKFYLPFTVNYIGRFKCDSSNDFVKNMNIPEDSDYFSDYSKLYTLLTERCGGECMTLDKFLKNTMNIKGEEKNIFGVLLQIMYTLIYFQEIGLQHNDLHSGNIFVIKKEYSTNIRLQFTKDIGVFFHSMYQIQIYDYDFSSIVKQNNKIDNERWMNMSNYDKTYFCISNKNNFGVRDTWQVLWWINRELKNTKNKELYYLFSEYSKIFASQYSKEVEEFFLTTGIDEAEDEDILESSWEQGEWVQFVFDMDKIISQNDTPMIEKKIKEFMNKQFSPGNLYEVEIGFKNILESKVDPITEIKRLKSIIINMQKESTFLDLTFGDKLEMGNYTTYNGCPCKSYTLYKSNGISIYNNYTEIYRSFQSSKTSLENLKNRPLEKERMNQIFSLLDEPLLGALTIQGILPSLSAKNCKVFTKSQKICETFK